jgi:hypothetical protein
MKSIYRYVLLLILAITVVAPAHAKNDKHPGKNLPPGLQKKAARGEPLPPGWQKKLQVGRIMDRDIYRHGTIVVPVDPHGLITVRVEGRLVRLVEATHEIIDILN